MDASPLSSERVRALLDRHRPVLLRLAAASIRQALASGAAPAVDLQAYETDLHEPGACFVTLRREGGELRGCIGSARAWRPLIADIAGNAAGAAIADPRFPPLQPAELDGLWLSLSVLTAPEPLPAASDSELLARVRPGLDGLILSDGARAAVLLPQVWEMLPDPAAFVAALKEKAGLPRDHWSPTLRLLRFGSVTIEAPDLFSP